MKKHDHRKDDDSMPNVEVTSRKSVTAPSRIPPGIEATINQLLDYISREQAVTFDEVLEYMDREHLRFGAGTNAIDILDLAAYRTGRIEVNYEDRKIYRRDGDAPEQPTRARTHEIQLTAHR